MHYTAWLTYTSLYQILFQFDFKVIKFLSKIISTKAWSEQTITQAVETTRSIISCIYEEGTSFVKTHNRRKKVLRLSGLTL